MQTSLIVVRLRSAIVLRTSRGTGSAQATAFPIPGRPSRAFAGFTHSPSLTTPAVVCSRVRIGRTRAGPSWTGPARPTCADNMGRSPSSGSSRLSISCVERMPSAIEWWNRVTTALPPS